ncbi:MAG: response regulator [Anaerolineae bacterium]|nr:response regulator [Anaerolineae bacterium]
MTAQQDSILIVDDTPANLRLLASILVNANYLVRPARDGKAALASAHSAPPDLILLDVMMPGMDGYEVCERLKADERTGDIPVIFISALDDIQDKVKSFAVGGVDYIPKPFHAEEVLARVKTHLTIRKLQQNLNEQIAELDAFAHTVAHDLKNPLALIVGFSDFLVDANDRISEEHRAEHLRKIQKAGNKAANIIDELLLLSTVRKQNINLSPLNMAAILLTAQDRLTYMIAEYQAEISVATNWPTAVGYAPWVEEIWVNYLSNGIKYGGNPPKLEIGGETLTDGRVRFWVKDNGLGIDPEDQKRLFAEFVRIGQTRIQGHGLGLSIVQRISQKLNGEVGVHSVLGEGSEFYFILPSAF